MKKHQIIKLLHWKKTNIVIVTINSTTFAIYVSIAIIIQSNSN